ncbi:MAG: hypothetical protein QOH38_74 [Thermoleophilaceae bacterium]|nr:hypothetical protein [Thermoleophilaceae bacterium]
MSGVTAVVLTRDRRELLLECVHGLLGGTRAPEEILVVDNAGSDGGGEAAAELPRVHVMRLERNAGSAGGFAAGLTTAASGGAEWIWLFDDDAEPEPDALARLLEAPAAADPETAALCSAVIGPDGDVDVLHRGFVGRLIRALPAEAYQARTAPRVGYSSFTGLLVRGDVARAIAPPRADFFIWGDDVEYTLRVAERGAIVLVPESRVLHKALMGGVATRRSRFWNRVFGTSYPSAPLEGFWKNLHLVRNFTWIRYHHGRSGPGTVPFVVAAYSVKSLLYDHRPLRRIPWIARAALRGRRGDPLGLTPERWHEICRGE